jgi:hypothetical protein
MRWNRRHPRVEEIRNLSTLTDFQSCYKFGSDANASFFPPPITLQTPHHNDDDNNPDAMLQAAFQDMTRVIFSFERLDAEFERCRTFLYSDSTFIDRLLMPRVLQKYYFKEETHKNPTFADKKKSLPPRPVLLRSSNKKAERRRRKNNAADTAVGVSHTAADNHTNFQSQLCQDFATKLNICFDKPAPLNCNFEHVPKIVYAVVGTNLDLFAIHFAVKAKYSYMLSCGPQTIQTTNDSCSFINETAMPLDKSLMTTAEICNHRANKQKISAFTNDVLSGKVWNMYIDVAKPIILRGIEHVKATSTLFFPIADVIDFLSAAENIVLIRTFVTLPERTSCPACGRGSRCKATTTSDETPFSPNSRRGYVVCEEDLSTCQCGYKPITVSNITDTFKDTTSAVSGSKNAYDNLGNFIKRIDAFEGKRRNPPPKMLYEQLASFFELNPLPCGLTTHEIYDLPHDADGRKSGTSVSLLEEALLKTNNSAYYPDVDIIGHHMWGWKLADLTTNGLRKLLIEDYIRTQQVYRRIKERQSSLNVNLRLYFHLRARGYACSLQNFKIVSSVKSIRYHNKMMAEMCSQVGLPIVTIPEDCRDIINREDGDVFVDDTDDKND